MRQFALLLCLCLAVGATAQSAFLGIQSETISKKKAKVLGFTNLYGSYVTKVIPGSPAEKAGLKPFDYIFGIDRLTAREDRDLSDMLSQYRAGDEATVYYMRKNKSLKADVTFATRSSEPVASSQKKAFLGVSPFSNDDEDDEDPGVRVDIISNSSAAEMGLKNGDRIMKINGYPMLDWDDISIAIGMLSAGDAIEVECEREGKVKTIEGKIKSYDESRTKTEYTWAPKPQERAFLGITSNNVSSEKAAALGFTNAYGSYITEIIPGTAAEDAGLQPFDYVHGINNDRTNEDNDLSALLAKYKAGDRATIHFIRMGKEQSKEVTFVSRNSARTVVKNRCDKAFLGVSEGSWNEERPGQGVPVEIVANSTAAEMGLKDGDVLLKINGYPILEWSDVSAAVSNLKPRADITVTYRRGNAEIEHTLPVKSLCDTKGQEDNEWNFNFDWKDLPGIPNKNQQPAADEKYEPVNLGSATAGFKNLETAEAADLNTRYNLGLSADNSLTLEDVRLQPDPNIGRFRLQFRLPGSGLTNVRIFNATGRLIYEYELGVFSGEFSDDVDISQNGAGSYYLEVRQGERSSTKKITLQN
ncbi:MAG: PDZ domain-containing protein [Saprospiraceae bacterium]|nr:PDZ domain-containing protein [Saprospiraceae bacterium]